MKDHNAFLHKIPHLTPDELLILYRDTKERLTVLRAQGKHTHFWGFVEGNFEFGFISPEEYLYRIAVCLKDGEPMRREAGLVAMLYRLGYEHWQQIVLGKK